MVVEVVALNGDAVDKLCKGSVSDGPDQALLHGLDGLVLFGFAFLFALGGVGLGAVVGGNCCRLHAGGLGVVWGVGFGVS